MKANTKINLALATGIGLACIAAPASATEYQKYHLTVTMVWYNSGTQSSFYGGAYKSAEACEAAFTAWKNSAIPAQKNLVALNIVPLHACAPDEIVPPEAAP